MTRTLPIALSIVALMGGRASAESKPLNLQSAKIVQQKPVGKVEAIDAATVIAQANAYFNDDATMIAKFTQIGGDGRRTDGQLLVDRPGKMRFAYAPPATLEIVADGSSVAVIDRKLHTQDLYFIGQTPLKFLLNDHVDLANDTKITNVTGDATTASIDVEDHATFGGTSKIRLTFDRQPFALRQWTVVDPQGYETVVSLSDIDLATKPDDGQFKINTERMMDSR
ncbi:MAG: LolA family protein [Janthinobacterium lividum]